MIVDTEEKIRIGGLAVLRSVRTRYRHDGQDQGRILSGSIRSTVEACPKDGLEKTKGYQEEVVPEMFKGG